MAGRDTTRVMRALMACLQPLVGTRAAGSAFIKSTGGTVVLPANTFGAPIITSVSGAKQVDWSRLVRTDAEATFDTLGESVPVTSLLGGLDCNLPIGTKIRWDPPIQGVELVSELDAAMVGGLQSVGPGSLARVATYEGVGASRVALDLFLAKVGKYPAAVISWDRTEAPAKLRRTQEGVRDLWTITVVTSRSDATEQRTAEWLYIKDAIEGELQGRSSVDGYVFSAPDVDSLGSSRLATTETSYVYAMVMGTWGEVGLTDRRVFYDWITTRLDVDVDGEFLYAGLEEGDKRIVDGLLISMVPGAFDSGFSSAFDIDAEAPPEPEP